MNSCSFLVATCITEFKQAVYQYVSYQTADADGVCLLNSSYYGRLHKIFQIVSTEIHEDTLPLSTLRQKMFNNWQLISVDTQNALQSIGYTVDPVIPNTFIAEISLTSNSFNLVFKNWIRALKDLPIAAKRNPAAKAALQAIFDKYMKR